MQWPCTPVRVQPQFMKVLAAKLSPIPVHPADNILIGRSSSSDCVRAFSNLDINPRFLIRSRFNVDFSIAGARLSRAPAHSHAYCPLVDITKLLFLNVDKRSADTVQLPVLPPRHAPEIYTATFLLVQKNKRETQLGTKHMAPPGGATSKRLDKPKTV